MTGFFGFIAIIGVILMFIGRRMILVHARQIGMGWALAIRFLPLADMMFLARYWDLAKTGAITSLIGLGLIAPWGGMTLWEMRHSFPKNKKGEDSYEYSGNGIWNLPEDEMVKRKEANLKALNIRMQEWYNVLQARRAALKPEAEAEVVAYNTEAAAYKELLAVSKEETAALQKLKMGDSK